MKEACALHPEQQHNVYVVIASASWIGISTFPWDPNALSAQGGTMVQDTWFGAGEKTLTHELGHALGLWHTHHGVSEVGNCSTCWERADGINGDWTGDFCVDTPPTPINYSCVPPGGTDWCSGRLWGATAPQNYMGYAGDSCWREFTRQQWGRMHAWISERLTGWLAPSPSPTAPEIEVSLGGVGLQDGQAATIDLGSVSQGQSGPTRTFTVRNSGNAALTLGGIGVPTGFTLTKELASSLAPGAQDTLTVRLDSAVSDFLSPWKLA